MFAESLRTINFPLLSPRDDGSHVVYLDSAATSLTPESVFSAMDEYYRSYNANVHRGIHSLSERATDVFEGVRTKVAEFIGAPEDYSIIFTSGTTQSFNMIAQGWGDEVLAPGDEIIVSSFEHHANLIPWQELCVRTGAVLRVVFHTDSLEFDMDAYDALLSTKTKLVSVTAVSNVVGTVLPLKEICRKAKKVGARVAIDAAQAVGHMPFSVSDIGCDFVAFSAHKMCGPTGVGVLCASPDVLAEMKPTQFGGGMIRAVTYESAEFLGAPDIFEPGTPNIAGVIGLGAAIDFLSDFDMGELHAHDVELSCYAREVLGSFPFVRLHAPPVGLGSGVVSFSIDGVHAHDVASIFNNHGIAIRSGHHCAQPLVKSLGVSSVARISFYLYSTKEDIDSCRKALEDVARIFSL